MLNLKTSFIMGKGDRKSRRGKIWKGSFGKTRPRKVQNAKSKKALKTRK